MNHATVLKHAEMHGGKASRLRDFILGWQDGLVNVLGVVLAVATATDSLSIVLVAAMAAAFAESISMAAVAYTSFKAEREYYETEVRREREEIKNTPEVEREEVRSIYRKMGFKDPLLGKIVKHITSDTKRWINVMMAHEVKLLPSKKSPANIAAVVGVSALFGSFIPIVPFLLLAVKSAMIASVFLSTAVLFLVGAYKAKTTVGNPAKSGAELALIGILAALIGYAIGTLMGAAAAG